MRNHQARVGGSSQGAIDLQDPKIGVGRAVHGEGVGTSDVVQAQVGVGQRDASHGDTGIHLHVKVGQAAIVNHQAIRGHIALGVFGAQRDRAVGHVHEANAGRSGQSQVILINIITGITRCE